MSGTESVYNLRYFVENGVKYGSFRESDKRRFFRLDDQDSRTTVAISMLRVTGMKKDTTPYTGSMSTLTRSGNGKHAEKQTVDQIEESIKKLRDSGTTLKTLTLVMNITFSPCNDCQDILQKFFVTLDCNITFVLRFAYLYHKDKLRKDDMLVQQLANWMIRLEGEDGEGFMMTVEAIEVTKELSDYSHCNTEGLEDAKKRRKDEDKAMKDTIEQVYTKKREIEEENHRRARAAAIALDKMRI